VSDDGLFRSLELFGSAHPHTHLAVTTVVVVPVVVVHVVIATPNM
jgi:hypothetical protein